MAHKDALSFVMGFVGNSKNYRSQFVERWREVIANFVVEPYGYGSNTVGDPYGKSRGVRGRRNSGIILKDGETHKVIMTYASKLVLGVLGDTRAEYVQAEAVGYEDAQSKAPTVSKLMRYAFSLPGVFRSMTEAITDMLLFGTSVVEIPWTYVEREMLVRNIENIDGIDVDSFSRQRVVAYDDIEINPIDIQDFYPDPSEYRLERMSGVAKRFRINAQEARARVGGELGYEKKAVEDAIANAGPDKNAGTDGRLGSSKHDDDFRENYDQPSDRNAHPDFKEMIGFEYTGDVPWIDDKGFSRKVVTILNNVPVRDIRYPYADEALPFRSMTINPVCGRFYGISPAEVIRYDQDLADAVKMLLAQAIIRQVHPPIAYDPVGDIDLAKLDAWSPDVKIPITGGPNMIGTVKYDANVFAGFALADANRISMQETSGAVAGIQGQQISTKRMSATEAQNTIQQAMDRPEMAAAMLERDTMPGIGRSILRRYQQFLADTDDLKLRVGEMPEPTWIGDILGDFDIRFVGSRMAMSRQQKLQAMDRLITYASVNPVFAAMLPNMQLAQQLIGDTLELPEIAAMVGDPQQFQLNLLMQQLLGGGAGNGNGTAVSAEPAGALPAQVGGAAVA